MEVIMTPSPPPKKNWPSKVLKLKNTKNYFLKKPNSGTGIHMEKYDLYMAKSSFHGQKNNQKENIIIIL